MPIFKYKQAASLLEVLVSIVISITLLVVISKIYFTVEQAWLAQQTSLADMEKTNVAYAWLSRDIVHAGYLGCVKFSKREKILGSHYLLSQSWLEISESGAELFAQYMSLDSVKLLDQINAYQVSVQVSDSQNQNIKFKENQIIIIEDCQNLIINKIKKISHRDSQSKQILTLYSPVYETFSEKDTRVGKLIAHKFLVKKTSRRKANNQKIYSLYLQDENNRWQELIENIDKIMFRRLGDNLIEVILDDENKSDPVIFKLESRNIEI